MQDFLKKFRVSSSVSKSQKLWAEFNKVSHLIDDAETLNKLKKFLDHVQDSLKLLAEKNENKKQIEGILGDASLILESLLKFLQDYDKAADSKSPNNVLANEIVNQVLEIVEFILREEKYRKQFENSQTILNNFLSVAEKLEKSESKVTVVELIIMIAENVDSKVSFVQKEGFSKLMKMLMDKDERVSRVISRALLHFLQIDNSEESRLLNQMQGQLEEKEEFSSIKKKIKKIALDFRKFTFNEIQRIFLQNDSAAQGVANGQEGSDSNRDKQPSIAKGTSLYQQGANSSPIKGTDGNIVNPTNAAEFGDPPTYEDIFETDLMLLIALKINQQQNINEQANIFSSDHLEVSINSNERVIQNNNQGNSQINIKPPSQQGSIIGEEFEETKNNQGSINYQGQGSQIKSAEQTSDQSDEVFTILAGGFKAILKTLSQGNQEVQLNLMQTIYKLLSSEDQKYKAEFKKVQGYEVLADVFNRVRNYTEERNVKFIQNLMSLYIDVIVSDKQRIQIMNFDAYEIFIRLISSSKQYEIIAHSLDCLKNLFLSNWKNLIIARRLKSTYHLLALTMRLFEIEYENVSSSILQPDNNENANTLVADQQKQNPDNHNEVSILEGLKYIYQINNHIYYTSEITSRNEPIGQQQREELLHKVNEIYKVYSYVEGTFSTEYEYAFSEIILKSITKEESKNSTIYFLDTLFEFLERKQSRKCCQISTFDNTFHPLMDCLKQIAAILLAKVTNSNSVKICLNDDESANYLGRFLFFTDQYLSCDHQRQEQKDERMKQLERENTLIKSIICRNQCEETKKLISDKYVNKLAEKEETKMLMRVIKLNKMKSDSNYTEFNYRVMTVLKDILVNNPARALQFIQMEGLSVLSYLTFKVIQDPTFMERVCMLFIDISLNLNNSQTILSNPLLKLDDEKIPVVEGKRVGCFNALFCTLINSHLNDSHHLFFEQLSRLLLKSENLRVFKSESYSLIFLLELLGSGRVLSNNNNLYTQILSIFERIIQKPNSNDIKLVLDSLLNSQNLKSLGTKKQDTAFFTDALSIMAIHILLNTTPPLNTRSTVLEKISPILEKIINEKYILNLFGCLDSPNPEVKEMVLKFILSCMSIYSKTKKNEVYGKKEHFYYLLSQKLQNGKVSQNLCKILYDFTFWEYNPNILYPSNSSVVSTLLNRSEQAGNIMNLAKSQIEQMKIGKIITNIDMLEIFFKALKEYEAEDQSYENHITFRNEMLNVFEAVLDEPNNVNLILDQPNFLNWFYLLLPNNWKNLSDPHLNMNGSQQVFENTISKQSPTPNNNNSMNSLKSNNNVLSTQKNTPNSDKKQIDNSILGNDYTHAHLKSGSNDEVVRVNQNLFTDHKKASRDSSFRESSFTQGMGSSQYKQISNQMYMAYKMEKEKVFSIIHKIMTHFFHKKRGDFSEYVKRFIHPDDDFLIVVVKYFFNGLLSNQQNCILKDESASNFLKNFKEFIDNIDQLFGYEAEINILIHQCITKMMLKNSAKIRTSMKNLNLFDKRDSLIIRILSYELDGNVFVKVFEGISFEALLNLNEFRDKHALSSIVKIFIENQNNFSLKMLIMKILKNPSLSEKNQKYVVELLDSPKLIQFFYPQFQRRKQSSIAKCLQSNLNNSNTKNNNSNNDDNDQESDSNDEGDGEEEGKRNKSNSKHVHRGASFQDDFFKDFYSKENEDLRKQIMLRINKNLMPILHEKEEKEKSIRENKEQHRQKYSNTADKEVKKAKLKVSDLDIEINKRLKESQDDYYKKQKEFNDYTNKKLSDGESIYEKYSSNNIELSKQSSSKKL